MLKRKVKRLLTVGHSYVVRLNRGLAEGIRVAGNGEWEVTVAAPRFYKAKLKSETLEVGTDEKVVVVGLPAAFTKRMALALYGTQLRSLMTRSFDAIHCWEEPYMLSGVQVALWAPPNAQLTYTTFQNLQKSYPPPFNWLERFSMNRADGWVAAATLVERALQDRPGYKQRPHRIIGMGVDPSTHRPDREARARIRGTFGWADDDVPVVGYIGRLTEAKGLPMLLRVLDRLQGEWRALFVGSGPLDEDLRRWARRYGTRVRIVSAVSHGDVPDYLNAMDLMCVPSQTTTVWREQFGRVLIEAFACGVCVISSDSGEIPYVVADAATVVAEKDEDGWYRAVQALLFEPLRREPFIVRGHERVAANFTWSAVGAKYIAMFDAIQSTRGAPAALPQPMAHNESILTQP